MDNVSDRWRRGLVAFLAGATLLGCSGAAEPSAPDKASAQNGFTRPMTPEETAKGNVPAK